MQILISGIDISDIVTASQLVESCPSESEAITLSGSRRVDRIGGFRAALTINIGHVSCNRWRALSAQLKALPISVTVIQNGSPKPLQMSLEGELPTPYMYSDKDGDWFGGIIITLREVG